VASEQVEFGDLIYVDLNSETGRFIFSKLPIATTVIDTTDVRAEAENEKKAPFNGISISLPQVHAAVFLGC